MPQISIIMVTHDRADYLPLALAGVGGQDFNDWELIIVDDCSTDKTAEIVRSFSDQLAVDQPGAKVKYLKNASRLSIPQLRNLAIEQSVGKYIAVLDSDDLWLDRTKLSRQYEFLEANSQVVLAGSGAVVIDSQGQELGRILPPQTDADIKKNFLVKNPFFHSSVMYQKKAAEQAGLYDAKFKYGEDLDLWLRLADCGKLYNFPDYLIAYRRHSGNESARHLFRATASVCRIIARYRKKYGFRLSVFPAKVLSKGREFWRRFFSD